MMTDPKEKLNEIHDMVSKLYNEQTEDRFRGLEPRLDVTTDNQYGRALAVIAEHGPLRSQEMKEHIHSELGSRTLSRLYHGYMVDREGTRNNYKYEITPLGERALAESNQRDDNEQDGLNNYTNPWENTELSEQEYLALKTIRDVEGHQTTREMDSAFIANGGNGTTASGPALSPRVSKLYDRGYVDRPPEQPYRYWLTEKGKSVFDD